MANEKKKGKCQEQLEPGFIEQANALIDDSFKVKIDDPKYGHGISIRDHKLWVSVMNLHVCHVNDILVEKFAEKVAEYHAPIMAVLDKLQNQQATIVEDIKSLKEDLTELSAQHFRDVNEINSKLSNDEREIRLIKETLLQKKKRIDNLEKKDEEILKKLKSIDEEIHGEIPVTLFKTYRIEKYILAAALAILLSGIVTYISIQVHSSKMKAIHKNIPNMEVPK